MRVIRQNRPHRVATVLLVEDERAVREVLERWLVESGRCVVACRTFQEAKAYLAAHTPDLLVTDIRLRDYNGLQLVLHMCEKHPATACLVMTGHDDPVLRKEAEHLHARYLVKPFARSDFLAEIENLASGEEAPTSPVRNGTGRPASTGSTDQVH
jgi:two-component system response regulator HydG